MSSCDNEFGPRNELQPIADALLGYEMTRDVTQRPELKILEAGGIEPPSRGGLM